MTTHLSFPSARMTGWKNGWDQPANTAARLGHDCGYNVLPALIVFAFVTFFVAKLSAGELADRDGTTLPMRDFPNYLRGPMSMHLINHFLHSYGYLAVFLFVALESVGSPLPGETAVIAAALYAGSTHRLNIGLIALVAAVAAIAGDNGSYWLGQHGGSRLVRRYGHWVRLDTRKLKVGRYLFACHGGKIVFLGRFITALRTYAAFFAGLNAMRRSRFLVVNAAAGIMWAAACSFSAYALGRTAIRVGTDLTIGGVAVAGLLTVVVALVMNRIIRRFEERAAAAFPDPPLIRPC